MHTLEILLCLSLKARPPNSASWPLVLQLSLGLSLCSVTSLRSSWWLLQLQLKFLIKLVNVRGHLSLIQRKWFGYSWLILNLEGNWSIRWEIIYTYAAWKRTNPRSTHDCGQTLQKQGWAKVASVYLKLKDRQQWHLVKEVGMGAIFGGLLPGGGLAGNVLSCDLEPSMVYTHTESHCAKCLSCMHFPA